MTVDRRHLAETMLAMRGEYSEWSYHDITLLCRQMRDYHHNAESNTIRRMAKTGYLTKIEKLGRGCDNTPTKFVYLLNPKKEWP